MTLTLRSWNAEQARIRQYRRRRADAANRVAAWNDPKAVARRAKELRRAFPTAGPGVILPLAERGIDLDDPTDRSILRSLITADAKRKARNGAFTKPGEATRGTFEAAAAKAKVKSTAAPGNPATVFGRDPFSGPKLAVDRADNAGPGGFLSDVQKAAGDAYGFVSEKNDELTRSNQALIGGAADTVGLGDEVRGLSRAVFLALDTPMQLLNASFRSAAAGDRATVDDPFGVDVLERQFEQTQGGQATKALVEGRRVDVGSGWFPDLESKTAKAAARQSRLQSPYLIGGHAWTPGRFVANQVASPGSTEFDILSGTVDAAITIAADPLNPVFAHYTDVVRNRRVVNPGSLDVVADARAAVKEARAGYQAAVKEQRLATRAAERSQLEPTLFDDLRTPVERVAQADEALGEARRVLDEKVVARQSVFDEAVGAAGGNNKGWRPWINRKTTTQWFASPQGSEVINHHRGVAERIAGLADNVDNATDDAARATAEGAYKQAFDEAVYDSWLRHGKKGPVAFHEQLVTARDRQGVMGVFDDWLGTELREFPVEKQFRPGWSPRLDGYRWAQKMPSKPGLWLDDRDEAVVQADRWLRNAKVTRAERAEVFGSLVRAQGADEWYQVGDRMAQIVRERADKVYNVPDAWSKAATRLFGTEVDSQFRRFGVDAISGKNVDSPVAKIGDDGVVLPTPHLDVEQGTTFIPLPEARDIRALTKRWGGTAARWTRRAEANEIKAKAFREQANKAHEAGDHVGAAALEAESRRYNRYARAAHDVASGKNIADAVVGSSRVKVADGFAKTQKGWATKGMEVWRKARLFRPAWGVRVVAEEQARLWQYGLDGFFNHPIQAFAIVVGASPDSKLGQMFAKLPAALEADDADPIVKALAKRLGRSFTDDLGAWRGDAKGVAFEFDEGAYLEAMNDNFSILWETTNRGRGAGEHVMWDVAEGTNDPRWVDGVLGEVVRLRNSPTARAVANAADPDAAKAWLLGEGRGSFDRVFPPERMVRVSPDSPPKAVEELSADEIDRLAAWYVETVASRLQGVSGGNEAILEAIRTGRLNGKKLTVGQGYDDLVGDVRSMVDNGWEGPTFVRVPITRPNDSSRVGAFSHVVDQAMWYLMPLPSNKLSRSPAFRQLYWRRAEELAPYLDAADRAKLLLNARDAGVPRSIMRRIAGVAVSNESVGLNELDTISKAYALQTTRDLLYDLSERGQVWDQLRLLFPFGEAYQEVLSRWAKAIPQNPKILRRLGQGVAEARETGFFEKGPFGQEVFTWGPAEWLSEKLIGVPVPISGSVNGLSIAGNGLPGVGPVVQIPMAYLKRHSPTFDAWLQTDETGRNLYEFVFPYGDPYTGQPIEDLAALVLPTWVGQSLKFFETPEGDAQFSSTVGYIMNYKASTGDYDLHGPNAAEEMDRLLKDSTRDAKWFSVFRGVASATLPTAPIPRWAIRDKDNKLVEQTVIRDKYYKHLTEDGPDEAFRWLLDTYGEGAFLVAQGFTTTQGFLPRTTKQWAFVASHPEIRDKYPEIYGLLTPADPKGDFDFTGYELTLERERERISPRERLKLANHRLASYIYDREAAEFGDDPTDEQQDWLDRLNSALEQEYPGYGTGKVDRASTKRRVLELQRLVKDEGFARLRPDVVSGVRDYLTLRDEALVMQNDRDLTQRQISAAADAEDIREWLRKWGKKLAVEFPGFAPIWREVFVRELRVD